MIRKLQVDAFSSNIFKGNPAAVCVLTEPIPKELMQKIAFENNLSETAFIIKIGEKYKINWFTPTVEIDLCGHATLASAHVVFNHTDYTKDVVSFESEKHGLLTVVKTGDFYTLNFPEDIPTQIHLPKMIKNIIGNETNELYRSKTDYIAILKDESSILNFIPDLSAIETLDSNGLVITSAGDKVDFVSRYFAPQIGISEDPVTGAIHTALVPLWSNKLNKTILSAAQLSDRSGILSCEYESPLVKISGAAITYAEGHIYLD